MPAAATAVMTITIAENPTAPTYPPVRFSYRESYGTNSFLPAGDFYSARRSQTRGRSYGDPEGASPSVRRIDKSGLLGITEPEASGPRATLRSPRFLSGGKVVAPGIASPRRLECIGQLDPVLEVPGQATRANVAPVASVPFSVAPTPIERREGVRVDSCEALSVLGLNRPTKSASFDSLEPKRSRSSSETSSRVQAYDRDLECIEPTDLTPSCHGPSFRLQEGCEPRARTLGRLPHRFSLAKHDGNDRSEDAARYSETCCNFPSTIRGFPAFEGSWSLPPTHPGSLVAASTNAVVPPSPTLQEIRATRREETEGLRNLALGEERAEAEGCEHEPARNLLKDGESSRSGDELLDNDAIQTLRVIILSEQL